MNINNVFPSKYIKSGDLGDGDMILTISHVEVENIGSQGDQETKPVIYFEENEKGLVLNKTNARTVSDLYTPETDNWKGKRIAIFATEVDFQGKQTLSIRVRTRKPNDGKQPADVKLQPVPVYTDGLLQAIADKLAQAVKPLDPVLPLATIKTTDATLFNTLIDVYKAAQGAATTAKCDGAVSDNVLKSAHNVTQAYTFTINLLNAVAEQMSEAL